MAKLSIGRLISVSVNLSPLAAQAANLNSLLILGSTDVIDVSERMRGYNDLDAVAADFGTSAPEYLAAVLYFGQVPTPTQLYIGRWAESATHGLMKGAILTAAQQTLSNWTAIEDGEFKIAIDGAAATSVTGLDFSGATNLNGVASIIDTALAGASVTWDGSRFRVVSATTGASSTVGFASAVVGGTGTDISALLKLDSANGAAVNGIAAETAAAAAALFDDRFGRQWYALMFADGSLTDDHHLAVAAYIQGSGAHIYGITTTDTTVLDSAEDGDIASLLKLGGYTRTLCQYSENAYAVASFIGRAMVVNFNGNNTTITMMYKGEPGVVAESLTATQADTLESKRCNVYVNYDNDTAIVQHGVMSGPAWFDEIHGLDWLAQTLQTNVYNLLYTSTTKIPQTDAGVHLITTRCEAVLDQAVRNGLLAPGVWNSGGFGDLETGDTLDKGYYVYAAPVAQQLQADREARKSPVVQIAAKLAGAIHTVDILINVNR